ncbi:MAG: DUF3090 family protein, partial [Actinobacteria bacterium]|nr:DUF3090 family protein [Actinomycetota bacterium]
MNDEIEFHSVDRINIGAVGDPGQRTFLIQARSGDQIITLVCEKIQVLDLSERIYQLLLAAGQQSLARQIVRALAEGEEASVPPADFEEDEPAWRIGRLDLLYDTSLEMVALECDELTDSMIDQDEEDSLDQGPGSEARFWVTFAQ